MFQRIACVRPCPLVIPYRHQQTPNGKCHIRVPRCEESLHPITINQHCRGSRCVSHIFHATMAGYGCAPLLRPHTHSLPRSCGAWEGCSAWYLRSDVKLMFWRNSSIFFLPSRSMTSFLKLSPLRAAVGTPLLPSPYFFLIGHPSACHFILPTHPSLMHKFLFSCKTSSAFFRYISFSPVTVFIT